MPQLRPRFVRGVGQVRASGPGAGAVYLQTDHWRSKRAQALAYYGNKCYLCGVDGETAQIDIHHNDYSRLGGELMSDMIPLCRDCHERHHSSI